MYTQSQITSHSNNTHIYAPKGVEVKVLSEFDGVCMVEYNGDRFSCRMDKLGDKPPGEEIVIDNNFGLL